MSQTKTVLQDLKEKVDFSTERSGTYRFLTAKMNLGTPH